ncbi:MAG: dihydrolipoyl dehydrogenase [Magnetovibrio sp.]|nr:dihydrolipoyl dehydrogenase [Magnetovibrio sp.]
MESHTFDVIIMGGGPGGYVTAIRSSQLGFKTCLVEKQHLGGICLNWGCIPTKAILRSAEILGYMNSAANFGLKADNISFELDKIIERSRGISQRLNDGVEYLLKKNKVTVVKGHAKLNGPKAVEVVPNETNNVTEILKAEHIIVATGARPRILPGIEPDGKCVWSYFEALRPDIMPRSLLVIGSGAIGIEFASFYSMLGSKVTVVEILPQILPAEDAEIAECARKQFESNGISIMSESKITALKETKNSVTVTIENSKKKLSEITVDRVIVAVGVVGNIEEIGLETTRVKSENGSIVIDSFGRTDEPGVYAIGDVAGPPWLAHKAEHEGVLCIENIAGRSTTPIDKKKIPGCTYCHPQVASVGMTEKAAKESGYKTRIGRFPYVGNGKAIALGETDGLVKTVFNAETGELLGAHMVGTEVTELIQGFTIAIGLETTEQDLIHTIFPHPTLSEMMHESVLDAYNRAIHN